MDLNFRPMRTCEPIEGVPFLVLCHGNEAADFLVQQVQWFEGQMYPNALDFCVNWEDRITNAIGWIDLNNVNAPFTIDATPQADEAV